MSDLIIIPLLNRNVTLFPGPPFYFTDDIFIDKLTDDEHSAFYRDANTDYKNALDINKTKCIKLKANEINSDLAKSLKTKTTFCLNVFSDFPLVAIWAGILSGEKKLKIKEITDFEALAGINKIKSNKFKINRGIKRPVVSEFYKVIEKAVKNSPEIMFTLEKYNSSFLRTSFFDQVIDTTICFETLIPGNTELTYKLSLYTSFITAQTPEERENIFEEMKKLYDLRSKIVHGDVNGKSIAKILKKVQSDWPKYKSTLKKAVTYYLIFLSQKKKEDWALHLKKLVLGTEDKII